jgi:hypothetical protein
LTIRLSFAYPRPIGIDVGGFQQHPDWPKIGPSLLIASCLILAIHTARWPARSPDSTASDVELDREIDHAVHVAGRVLARLVAKEPSIFPDKKRPWYVANDDDVPK